MNSFYLTLPMPPSINAMHDYTKRVKGKHQMGVFRSSEYTDWIQYAGIEWRRQSNFGSLAMLHGRLRAQYVFIFDSDRDQDVNNREKCLSDFLQNKLFENDCQIDESFHWRRIMRHTPPKVHCWLTEIPDQRFIDMFNPDEMRI